MPRWPGDFLDRINARVKRQVERVEEMTGDMDPRTNFSLVVLQTELERYKFLVRSYLRARIAKVGAPFAPPPIPSLLPRRKERNKR